MSWNWFNRAAEHLARKRLDLQADEIRVIAVTDAWTPNDHTNQWRADVTNELATGGGYTAGGVALAGLAVVYTAADSWTVQRANTTAYVVGDIVRPAAANGRLYYCVQAGTSGGSVPSFPTVLGQTVADGGVIWVCAGTGMVRWTTTTTTLWTADATGFTFRRLVAFSVTSGADANSRALVAFFDPGSNQTAANGAVTLNQHAAGLLVKFTD